MASAANFARDLGFDVQCAVADTPAGAQAFATSHRDIIIAPGEESEELQKLSLPYLLALEGLEPWTRPSAVESIVTFFMMLGFKNLGDLSRFTSTSLQERWGETGALLWKRLHAQDRPMISALIPEEPLADYLHLDFPVSLASLLLREVEKSVDFLFARLQGRRCVARQLNLILHCEYSNTQHKIVLEPSSPSRDRDLFLTLLENRLGQVDLENPIRDFELLVTPGHEDSRQMDFFEPRNSDQDKLTTLMSLLTQSQLKPGLYRIEPSLTPEKSWTLGSSVEPPKQEGNREAFATQLTSGQIPATRPEPFYGAGVMQAPRPTRVLQTPRPLSLSEVARMRLLSSSPIERLENGWWETAEMRRDYYFALSPEGDCLWIFQDPRTADYFLHGYFD